MDTDTPIQRKRSFFKLPDLNATIEWFNISSTRLFLLSMITGGFYLFYWFYRQTKACAVWENKTVRNILVWLETILICFVPICSLGTFFTIESCLTMNKKQRSIKLYPILSGLLFGGLFSSTLRTIVVLYIIAFLPVVEDPLFSFWRFGTLTYFLWFVCIFIATLIVIRYQKAIQTYCKEKEVPPSKINLFEIVWVVIGLCLVYTYFRDLILCLTSFADINLFKVTSFYEKVSTAIKQQP